MKKLNFVFALFALILTSCGQSNEDKAKEMAANYLKGVLYHFDSYEPITTTVDSLFVSVVTDEEAISATLEFLKMCIAASKCVEDIQEAERSMDIWAPSGYSSTYSKGEYNRAKSDKEQQEQMLDKLKEKIQSQFLKIKEIQSNLHTGEFSGWKVYQKFRSLNGAGTMDLFGEYIFLCYKNFGNCLGYEKEEFDMLTKIMKAIEDSKEITDLQDKLMDLAY